jgi:pullulanase-type alpha-1,6-glucosidase
MTTDEASVVSIAAPPTHGRRGDLSLARAYWLTRDTLAWPLPSPGQRVFRLHAAPYGGLHLHPAGVSGGQTLELRYDPAGLDEAALAKFPHLRGCAALRLEPLAPEQLRHLLTGQVAVSASGPSGELLDATGLQLPGVLDDLYAYDGPLGATFASGAPTLRVWAPTARSVTLHLFERHDSPQGEVLPMRLDGRGVWSAAGPPEWRGRYYLYEIEVFVRATGRVERNFVTDPYALSLSANSERSQIVDLRDPALRPRGWDTLRKPPLAAFEDIVLYELHVRDFSVGDTSVPEHLRGTYLAFTQPESHGMRHLRGLAGDGLTHLHLLPAFDIATVEELRGRRREPDQAALRRLPPDSERQAALVEALDARDGFNWGYDPLHYSVPEGSYASDPNGTARIVEFRAMVQGLAAAGLRVVMDVVYNHTSASGQHPHAVLDRIVPGYYHRLNADGYVEHSTCCNNTASEHAMMERLLIDSTLLWATEYRVDGFRFDLMGHHMRANMLRLRERLDQLTPERDGVDGRLIYVYGEGWNFGEVANSARGVNATQLNMGGSRIGTFNDRLRDAVRGGTPFGNPTDQGFATGLYDAPNGTPQGSPEEQRRKLLHAADLLRAGLAGNLRDYALCDRTGALRRAGELDYSGQPAGYALAPCETINYVEAHDNETLFDAVQLKAARGTPLEERVRMHILASSTVLLAQGIPFIHAGQELLRSKSLDRNSYNSGDWFNRLDWTGQETAWGAGLPPGENRERWRLIRPLLADPALRPGPGEIQTAARAFRALLRIRSSSPLFRLRSAEAIRRQVLLLNGGPDQTPGLVVMALADDEAAPLDPRHRLIVVLFNASAQPQRFAHAGLAGRALALHPELAGDPHAAQARFDQDQGAFLTPPRSAVVFVEPRG